MEQEILEIWDESTVPTGRFASKSEIHKKGLFHATIHLWLYNPASKEVLIQKRAPQKDVFPDKWDVSVAGHVQRGESFENACKRELGEELGIEALSVLEFYFIQKSIKNHANIIDCEYVHVFSLEIDRGAHFNLDFNEVSDVKWLAYYDLNAHFFRDNFVNHDSDYLLKILAILEQKLK